MRVLLLLRPQVQVWQKLFFDGRIVATENTNPDFVALAKAYGFEAYCAKHVDDLPEVIDKFVNATGPVLVRATTKRTPSLTVSRLRSPSPTVARLFSRSHTVPRLRSPSCQVDFRCVPDICLPMVAPGKGLDEMFMPGTIDINASVDEAPKMEGLAPS